MLRPSTITEPSARSPHELPLVVQDPSQLVYALYLDEAARAFDRSRVTIVQHAALSAGAITIEVAIIGESHFACVRGGNRVLAVELLACVDPETLGAVATQAARYREDANLNITAETPELAITSIVRTDRRWWNASQPRPGQCALTLVEAFPGPASPRTIVGVRAQRMDTITRVWIDTVHEYALPDRVIAVTSATSITIGAVS